MSKPQYLTIDPAHRKRCENQRTQKDRAYSNHNQQRKALHLWLEMLAEEANQRGVTMQVILQQVAEVRPSKTLLKESVYKPLLKAVTDKDSTEDQLTTDLDPIVDAIVKLFAGLGVVAPAWPDRHSQSLSNLD